MEEWKLTSFSSAARPGRCLSVEAGPPVHVCPLPKLTAGRSSSSLVLAAEEAAAGGLLDTAAEMTCNDQSCVFPGT